MMISCSHQRMGFIGLFAFIVLLASFSRGLVPLLSGNASLANISYQTSAVLGMLLALIGIGFSLYKDSNVIATTLRNLLLFNLVLYIFWLIPVIIFNGNTNIMMSIVYGAIFPFSIYALVRVPSHWLLIAFRWATLLVAGTVLWDFFDLNTPFGAGLDAVIQRQLLLRPDNFSAIQSTGSLLRPNGIFGSGPHDAANFLAILGVFWLAMSFVERKGNILNFVFAIVTFLALMAGQVASNIMAYFAGLLVLMLLLASTLQLKNVLVGFFVLSLLCLGLYQLLAMIFHNPMDLIFHWTVRIGAGGDWQGMIRTGAQYTFGDLAVLFVGHSLSFNISDIGKTTEVVFLGQLVSLGVPGFIVFMSLLIYPLLRFMRADKERRIKALPYALAVFVGIVSLWHYGSVFRTTNIFVFFAMYAQILVLTSTTFHHGMPQPLAKAKAINHG